MRSHGMSYIRTHLRSLVENVVQIERVYLNINKSLFVHNIRSDAHRKKETLYIKYLPYIIARFKFIKYYFTPFLCYTLNLNSTTSPSAMT